MPELPRHDAQWKKPVIKGHVVICKIPYLYEMSRIGQFTETEIRLVVARDRGEEEMGSGC